MSVAALGPIVQEAAAEGDAVATRILERAAEELVLAARSVATRLEMRGDAFTFYLAGGVFRSCRGWPTELPRRLVEVAPRCAGPGAGRRAGGRRRVARARRGPRAAHVPRYKSDGTSGLTPTPCVFASSRPTSGSRERSRCGIARRCWPRNPRLVLGLPTGRTPIPLYRELVRLHRRRPRRLQSRRRRSTSTSSSASARDDPRSYRAFMQRHLFDHVNLPPRRIHFLNGAARGSSRARMRPLRTRDRARRRHRSADSRARLNGHIGFNEPARALVARTHRTRLTPATRRANASLFGNRAAARAARGAVDGDGDDSSREADRAAGDRRDQGAVRRADDRRTGHAAAAGVVSAAAPRTPRCGSIGAAAAIGRSSDL